MLMKKINPTDLTFFDPCMGSGHILVYAFDVLMEIYREVGYSDRDAALSIVENNLLVWILISVHISWHILQ